MGSSTQGYLEGLERVKSLLLGRLPEDLVFKVTVGEKEVGRKSLVQWPEGGRRAETVQAWTYPTKT